MRNLFAAISPLFALILISADAAQSETSFPAPYNSEPGNPSPIPPAEALSKIRMPEGFKATLFAAEPEIQNPVGLTWDHRGRLWVVENYTYAETAKRFDLGLRDRVVILEDKDHDGRAETRKVFIDHVQKLTSVEMGKGGVWLMAPPQLLFVPDANGDDVPDGPPQVVLDGFTVAESNYHNLANGLKWGPDGWLYGRSGLACPGNIGLPGTPENERRPIHGGIWRFHPERKTVEVLTQGSVNPWGHDWDEHGEGFFINTVIGHLWPIIPGAFNKQMSEFPSHQNPAVYERMEMIADHWHFDTAGKWQDSRDGRANDFGGGHAHVGMMIYQADQWPASFRNKLFTLNLHGRRANVERLEREGSGYRGRHEPDAFFFDDPWFRGIEISTGPDGSAYVLDWSDTGECHESNGVHRTSGRIFKLSYGDPKAPELGDLEKLTPSGVERLLRHPNVWFERQLRTQLISQPVVPEIAQLLQAIAIDPKNSTVHRLRALWACNALGPVPQPVLLDLLQEKDEHLRVWAIRLLTDQLPLDSITGPKITVPPVDSSLLQTFVQLASQDPSGLVKLTLASTLQRLPVQQRLEVARALVRDTAYANDPHLPYLAWFGIIPLGEANPAALIEIAKASMWPQTTRWIARNFTSRIDSKLAELDQLLAIAPSLSPALQAAVLQGISEGLTGRKSAPKPTGWGEIVSRLHQNEAISPLLLRLGTVFGDTNALDALKAVALDSQAEIPARQAALKALIEAQPADLREICQSLLATPKLSTTAIRGLSLFDDPAIGTDLAKRYPGLSPEERAEVVSVLVTRPAWAATLLESLQNQTIQKTALTAFGARQIAAFKDAALTEKLTEVWGTLNDSAAEKRGQMHQLKAQLTPEILAKADLGKGRQLFAPLCGACHKLYGDGGTIGPDLTGSGRSNLDYILENVVDPSAVVSADYRVTTLTLKDGRLLAGTVATQTDRTLTLRQPAGDVTLEKTEIAKQETSAVSMMPEGLLTALQPDQIRDLVAYLMHPSQVELPSTVGMELTGDWQVRVTSAEPAVQTVIEIAPLQEVEIVSERHDSIPTYNPNGGGWNNGARLSQLIAEACSTPGLLDPESVILKAGTDANSPTFSRGSDYEIDLSWATFGRVAGGRIGENTPVFATYRYTPQRVDSVVLTSEGKLALRQGKAAVATPPLPEVAPGEKLVGNVWVLGKMPKLHQDSLFPVLETAFPEAPEAAISGAEKSLPKTLAKLRAGKPVRILAWGDSVTECVYLPQEEKWQEQFASRLRAAFPQSEIELLTEGWGGRSTESYLTAPPGSPRNYEEKVLALKPDLIISEFVNDAGLDPAGVESRYGRILADFQRIGSEWIILTPHYVRPDWMGLSSQREVDEDPRPYVAGLRAFSAKHNVALADASLRYGRLWRQGIPYTILMVNSINHPDARGMKLFADALMAVFPLPDLPRTAEAH